MPDKKCTVARVVFRDGEFADFSDLGLAFSCAMNMSDAVSVSSRPAGEDSDEVLWEEDSLSIEEVCTSLGIKLKLQ